MRAGGHHFGEAFFGAAECFRDDGCNVIGRFGHQCADGIADRNRLADAQPQLAAGTFRRTGRDRQGLIEPDPVRLERLEDQVEGHHFCQRGGVNPGIGIDRMKHGTGSLVHDQRRIAGCHGCLGYGGQRDKRNAENRSS